MSAREVYQAVRLSTTRDTETLAAALTADLCGAYRRAAPSSDPLTPEIRLRLAAVARDRSLAVVRATNSVLRAALDALPSDAPREASLAASRACAAELARRATSDIRADLDALAREAAAGA